MASEYLKWKYRDVKREQRAGLTPEEKRRNWWHYYKWHVVIGVVLAGIGTSILCRVLGVGQTRPDYQIAYVGENTLPDDTAAVEAAFGIYRSYAVSVELACREGYDGDASLLPGEFLESCHYALP